MGKQYKYEYEHHNRIGLQIKARVIKPFNIVKELPPRPIRDDRPTDTQLHIARLKGLNGHDSFINAAEISQLHIILPFI